MLVNKSANEALSSQTTGIETLGLNVGGKDIEPGQYIPKAEAQSLPELYLPNAQGTYLVVCLDMDPPFVTAPFLGPALHWMQSGFKLVSGSRTMVTDQPFIVDYVGPGPPPGSGPHRYAFFLYLQPDDFEVKSHAPPNGQKVGVAKRIRYDLDRFEKEAGLRKIVAMNYFKSN